MSNRWIIGDSIAHGTDGVLKWGGDYHDGRSFEDISTLAVPKGLDVLVVSTGSNPAQKTPLQWADFKPSLRRIRAKTSTRVIWIVPAPRFTRERAEIIDALAEFDHSGSRNLPVMFEPGPDGVHPQSYLILAANVARLAELPA